MRNPALVAAVTIAALITLGLVAGLVWHNSPWIALALVVVTPILAWLCMFFARRQERCKDCPEDRPECGGPPDESPPTAGRVWPR